MLARFALRAADDRIYEVPPGRTIVVHAIYFANTTGSRRTIRMHHVSQGQSSGTDNALFYDVAIAPNGTLIDSTRFQLGKGDQLRGKADAAGVTCTVYGIAVA